MSSERSLAEKYLFAFQSGKAIGKGEYSPLSREVISTFARLNIEQSDKPQNPNSDSILQEMALTLAKTGADLKNRDLWIELPWSDKPVDYVDLAGILVSFTDLTRKYYPDTKIPEYLMPPKELVDRFSSLILCSDHPLTLAEQFEIAMKLADNHPTAASLLATLSCRHLARGAESGFYGPVDHGNMLKFYQQIAGFRDISPPNDSEDPGDTYYFWTNIAWAMCMEATRMSLRPDRTLLKETFKKGAPIMTFFRKFKAKQPNATSHNTPSQMGLSIGKKLADQYL